MSSLALVEDPSSALSDPDLLVFRLWLQGHSVSRAAELLCALELQRGEEAELDVLNIFANLNGGANNVDLHESKTNANDADRRHATASPPASQPAPAFYSVSRQVLTLFQHEVQNSYRTFGVFEALLEQPVLLGLQSQIECPVDNASQRQRLVALYYGFDPVVFREFLGLKLTSRLRSNLDDVSDRTGIPIRSVRRQFDNLKRIHSRFDDVAVFRGNVMSVCLREFCLPPIVAERYAAASFLMFHRFDLETSERKYQFLTWGDCEYMALQLMSRWVTRPILQRSDMNMQGVETGTTETTSGLAHIDTIFDGTGTVNIEGSKTGMLPQRLDSPMLASVTYRGAERLGDKPMLDVIQSSTYTSDLENAETKVMAQKKLDRSNAILKGSKSLDEFQLGGGGASSPESTEIRRLSSNWGTFVSNSTRKSGNASVDATGAQFALDRRSSMDLDPGWLSNLRLMKSEIQSRANALDTIAKRVASIVLHAESSFAAVGADDGSPKVASKLKGIGTDVPASSGRHAPLTKSPMHHAASAPAMTASKSTFKSLSNKAAREVIRNMLTIAGNLSQAKELRDFFEDVMERVCDPLLQAMGMRSYMNRVASMQQLSSSGVSNDRKVSSYNAGVYGPQTTRHSVGDNNEVRIQKGSLDLFLGKSEKVRSNQRATNSKSMSDAQMCVSCTVAFFRATYDATKETYRAHASPAARRETLLRSWQAYLDVVACCAVRMMKRRLQLVRV